MKPKVRLAVAELLLAVDAAALAGVCGLERLDAARRGLEVAVDDPVPGRTELETVALRLTGSAG